jgi:hypothetical protein
VSSSRLTLVVLAAGMGSRFGGAKQIEPVGPSGETIIDYSIYDALRAGFDRVVFVTRPDLEPLLRARFDEPLVGRCSTVYIHQRLDDLPEGCEPPVGREKPWGTGHALYCCRDAVTEPFAVVNADDFYGAEAFTALRDFLLGPVNATHEPYALVGYPLDATLTPHGSVSRGVCHVDRLGHLESIVERRRVARTPEGIAFSEDGETWQRIPEETIASMNLWGFRPSLLPAIERELRDFLHADPAPSEELRIPTVVGTLIEEGAVRVHVLRTTATWYGVTYREDLPWVRREIGALVERGAYPSPLWKEAPESR